MIVNTLVATVDPRPNGQSTNGQSANGYSINGQSANGQPSHHGLGTSNEHPQRRTLRPEVADYVRHVEEMAAGLRVPDLFARPHPQALYHLANRHGVSALALRTRHLTMDQLTAILTFRLAQYVHLGYRDAELSYNTGLTHEPLDSVGPDDVHYLAGDAETGRILCYQYVHPASHAPAGTTLATPGRPPVSYEEIFGRGIFDRLRILPDLPLERVWDWGRLVKDQQLKPHDELGVRAPAELSVATYRSIIGPLREHVDAFLGGGMEGNSLATMAFCQLSVAVMRGTVPLLPPDHPLLRAVVDNVMHPCATYVPDLFAMADRMAAIDAALELPGRAAMKALFSLKRTAGLRPSSFEPTSGFDPLCHTVIQQTDLSEAARRRLYRQGELLRRFAPLAKLTEPEAVALGTLMAQVSAPAGGTVLQRGQRSSGLFLILSGKVELRTAGPAVAPVVLARLGAGDFFGESGLVTGCQEPASAVAITPARLLRLDWSKFDAFLNHRPDIRLAVSATALQRIAAAYWVGENGAVRV